MSSNHYPPGSVRDLLETNFVRPDTRIVLEDRLERKKTIIPVFFDLKAFQVLTSACMRLIPQYDRQEIVDLPGLFDEKLASGTGKGWRYNQMPADKIVYALGLHGIDETAELLYDKIFFLLKEEEQDHVLTEIQTGNAEGKTWKQMSSGIFFEELLASLAELYYSHPMAKEEIGEVAFADAKGWQKIGLNELEIQEPLPLKKTDNGK